MRKDILINVNSENNKVKIDNKTLGITSENLQGKIIFKPEPFVDGVCRLYVDGKGSILMEKQEDCYTVNILSSLLTEDSLDVCFKITEPETEDGIPIFCSKIMHFRVLETIDSSSTIPEDYPSWEQVLDSMMAKVEQMESDAEDRLDEVVGQIQDLTSAYNSNATNKTNEFNANATNKTTAFNQNYASKVTEIDEAVNSAKTELDDYTEDKKDEIDGCIDDLKSELDTYETAKEGELDIYTNSKKTELNTYTNSKKSNLDDYEETKETALNTLAGNLTSAFNSNANSKTSDFNDNATSKTGDFNTNATSKTSAYDENASTKLGAYNTNHTTKLAEYNSNATSKVSDYNTNAITKTSEFDQNASDKTDDFDDNASAKTTAFNDNATAKIAEYDAHVSELQSQVNDLETLVETELDTNTVEGTEIDVSDSAEYRGPVMPGANLEQEQLSGKNLLNFSKWTSKEVNGVRWTNNGDGTVTANGTATDNSDFYVIKDYSTKYTGDYTISGCPSGGSATTYYVLQDIGNKSDFGNGVTKSFNNESFAVRLRIMKGYTANGILFKPMIELGITKTDFEQYCGGQASPNPSYPQNIEVVTGDNVVKHVGKNLFDKDNPIEKRGSINNNNIFRGGGGNYCIVIPCKPNTTYTAQKRNDGDTNRLALASCETNPSDTADVDTPLLNNVRNDSAGNLSITTGSTANYIIMQYYRNVESTLTKQQILDSIQIEEGSTATSYEPYREEEYELSLGNIELCKIGDYEDEFFKNVVGDENYNAELESGAWYKKKVIDKKILDDSWTWFMPTTNRFHVNIPLPDGEYDLVALCDKFINALYWPVHINTDKSFIVHNGNWGNNMCRISFLDSDYDSLDEWTQFVSENNLIVYHRLLNPTYEKITDPKLISQLEALRKAKWFKGINHWWTETENLEPNLKGTYKQSNNLRIKEQDERLDNLESRLALLE